MAYLLDANVFISAKDLHYGFDFCPAFWDWIERESNAGNVMSVEHVGGELKAGEDELADWAQQHDKRFFMPADATTVPALEAVATWITDHERYSPAAKNTFLQVADYYVVAQALAGGHVVVTHERPAESVHRVKIPNVCLGLSVRYMNPFEMLRRQRARFVLGVPA